MRLSTIILVITLLWGLHNTSNAQTLKVAAGNTLIGTVNGAALGLSAMGLRNDSDFTPVRFGLGAGTLFGLGVGIYDVSNLEGLGFNYVEGLFNSTEYSALIILLDTAYGSVTGSVLGMAIALMANENVVRYMQYGASAGAFAGFTFGLVDAFYLSSSSSIYSDLQPSNREADGFINLSYKSNTDTNFQVGLIHPTLLQSKTYKNDSTKLAYHPTLQVFHLKVNF